MQRRPSGLDASRYSTDIDNSKVLYPLVDDDSSTSDVLSPCSIRVKSADVMCSRSGKCRAARWRADRGTGLCWLMRGADVDAEPKPAGSNTVRLCCPTVTTRRGQDSTRNSHHMGHISTRLQVLFRFCLSPQQGKGQGPLRHRTRSTAVIMLVAGSVHSAGREPCSRPSVGCGFVTAIARTGED